MEQEELIRKVMAQVMANLDGNEAKFVTKPAAATAPPASSAGPGSSAAGVTSQQYPLGEKVPERIRTVTGKEFSDVTYENVISGKLGAGDLRISPDTLAMQAQVAESVGRAGLAGNFRRAAELIPVPDEELLAVYDALRPYRSTKAELLTLADKLERDYGCTINAAFIREAAEVYESRGRLRVD